MFRWIRRNWALLAFVLVNLAVAAPAHAMLGDDFCEDANGNAVHCCTLCIGVCQCHVT
jgi:hypothetical protein